MPSLVPANWKNVFLLHLAENGCITWAARKAGMARSAVYEHRSNDPDFAARWAEAVEIGTESLEIEAHKRAMDASDNLLMFLLKSKRPEIYRENVIIAFDREIEAVANRLGTMAAGTENEIIISSEGDGSTNSLARIDGS